MDIKTNGQLNILVLLISDYIISICIEFNQSECRFQKPKSQLEAGKFCAQSKVLVGWNPAEFFKRNLKCPRQACIIRLVTIDALQCTVNVAF